jgi:hypothetical protein
MLLVDDMKGVVERGSKSSTFVALCGDDLVLCLWSHIDKAISSEMEVSLFSEEGGRDRERSGWLSRVRRGFPFD